jgi:hypothetical protein
MISEITIYTFSQILIELDLRHNEIGDKGAQYLADASKNANTVHRILYPSLS